MQIEKCPPGLAGCRSKHTKSWEEEEDEGHFVSKCRSLTRSLVGVTLLVMRVCLFVCNNYPFSMVEWLG